MQISDNTPVLVASGQIVDRLGDGWRGLSPADLAAEALNAAVAATNVTDLATFQNEYAARISSDACDKIISKNDPTSVIQPSFSTTYVFTLP